jgi:VanZ family protein
LAAVRRASGYTWLALGLAVLVVHGSLIPYSYRPLNFADAVQSFRNLSWHDTAPLEPRGDWVVTVLTYAALSFALMAAVRVEWRAASAAFSTLATALACGMLALALEFVQVYFPPRTVSLNDVVLAAVGSCLGPLCWLAVGPRLTDWARHLGSGGGVDSLAARLLPAYVLGLLALELMPFDLVVRPHELFVKYEEGKVWLLPFHAPENDNLRAALGTLLTLACYFPLGFLATLTTGRFSLRNRSWEGVLLTGLAGAAALEGFKLFVYTRTTDATQLVLGPVGVLLGWRLGRAVLVYLQGSRPRATGELTVASSRPAPWGVLALVWLALVVALNWRPFDFTTNPAAFAPEEQPSRTGLQRMSWIPLAEYYWGSKYQLIDQSADKFLAFVPLGLLAGLGLRGFRHGLAALLVVGVALAIAFVIEIGQCYLPERSAGLTDVLIESLGAGLGWLVTQQIRAIVLAERPLSGEGLSGM